MAAPGKTQGIVLGKYTLLDEIGRGELSIVCKAKRMDTMENCAIKRIILKADKSDAKTILKRAIGMGKHERVVDIKDFYFHHTEPRMYIVYECSMDNLNDYMTNHEVDGGEKLAYMEDVAKGLQFLHRKGLTHGDLRPPNIMMASVQHRKVCKVGDYCVALLQQLRSKPSETHDIAEFYEAPEVTKSKAFSQAADIYSLALIFYVISAEKRTKRRGRDLLVPALTVGDDVFTIGALVRGGDVEKALLPRFSNLRILGEAIVAMLSMHPNDRPAVDKVLPKVSEARLAFQARAIPNDPNVHKLLRKMMQDLINK